MSLTLRTTLGCTEAVIADDGGLKQFYHVADVLSQDFKINFSNKEDDFDSIDWEFRFKGHNLTLHYSIYNGISIFPTKTRDALNKDNKAVEDYNVSGIPTKFIINKNGNIQFSSIGFGGDGDELLEEISMMIDMAKANNS